VVSFYTLKCQFKCAHCALPDRSSPVPIGSEHINGQVDRTLSRHEGRCSEFTQFSFGNEGSVLDADRFPIGSLHYLLGRLHELPNLAIVSLETRPEYVTHERLRDVTRRSNAPIIDLAVGFETQDDHTRMAVLGKRISRKAMERCVALLSSFTSRL